jgi:tetratricopeptide (TPR) repeat protein
MRRSRFRAASLALAAALAGLAVASAFARIDVDSLWEYGDPAASEARFRAELAAAKGDDRLELLTQIARTYSLRNRFMEAHRILDEVQPRLAHAGPRPRIRYLLERGRAFNSDGAPERARPFFLEAFERARKAREEGLAVDAAHMVAITWAGTTRGLAWNRRGLAIARASHDAKAQALVPALLNNSAWDLYRLHRYPQALHAFEDAERAWSTSGGPAQVSIARWSVAHCLRALGRDRQALAILLPLAAGPHSESLRGDILDEIALDTQALAGIARVRR